MNVRVKQATLKSGLFLSYKYVVNINGTVNSNSTASDAVIHDDLKNAFRNLIPFFAHISDEIKDSELISEAIADPAAYLEKTEDEDKNKANPFLKYKVGAFQVDVKRNGEMVTLSGTKHLESGDIVGWDTPAVRFDGDYLYIDLLSTAIEHIKNEVFEYMQGKQAPVADQTIGLFEGDDDEDDNNF